MTVFGPDTLCAVRASIARYYTEKARKHGATPIGVDWPSIASQQLRFVQLLKVVDFGQAVSIHDLGCGYGALLEHLADRHDAVVVDYWGSDASATMIRLARRKWLGRSHARFVVAPADVPKVDYTVASGIFNVNLDQSLQAWEYFVSTTLADMASNSRKGFAVNFMAPPPSSSDVSCNPLYRTPRCRWLEYSSQALGCRVELVDAYGLREYTLLARH